MEESEPVFKETDPLSRKSFTGCSLIWLDFSLVTVTRGTVTRGTVCHLHVLPWQHISSASFWEQEILNIATEKRSEVLGKDFKWKYWEKENSTINHLQLASHAEIFVTNCSEQIWTGNKSKEKNFKFQRRRKKKNKNRHTMYRRISSGLWYVLIIYTYLTLYSWQHSCALVPFYLLFKYSGTSPKDHLNIKTTSILRPLYLVPKISPMKTMLNWFRIKTTSIFRIKTT